MHARVCISCYFKAICSPECESSLEMVNYFINTSLISARPSAHRFSSLSRLGNPFVFVNIAQLHLLPVTSFEAAANHCSSLTAASVNGADYLGL